LLSVAPLQGEGSRHAKPGLYQEDTATAPDLIRGVKVKRIRIGDVIEIRAAKGLAYAQYSHKKEHGTTRR
jgi:hypothetical protein